MAILYDRPSLALRRQLTAESTEGAEVLRTKWVPKDGQSNFVPVLKVRTRGGAVGWVDGAR